MTELRLYKSPSFALIDSLFNDLPKKFTHELSHVGAATNIIEKEENYLVSIDAPGFEKSELEIEYTDGVLTVLGFKENRDAYDQNEHVLLLERRSRSFKRSFRIPEVNEAAIEASYDHGVLHIWLPKKEAAKAKKIPIGEGQPFIK